MVARVSQETAKTSPVEVVPDAVGGEGVVSKKRPVRLIAGSVLAAGMLGVVAWYFAHAGLESTDDAQVEADVVAVPSRTTGVVVRVDFQENQPVKAGDVLVEVDPVPAQA